MTERPTRATASGRAYLDLRKAATATGRPADELLQLYALEGLLDRLGSSPHAEHFVLKGGVLLAANDARRPTRDIHLAAIDVVNDLDHIRQLVNEIVAVDLDDGLEFDLTATSAEAIRFRPLREILAGYSEVPNSMGSVASQAAPHRHDTEPVRRPPRSSPRVR